MKVPKTEKSQKNVNASNSKEIAGTNERQYKYKSLVVEEQGAKNQSTPDSSLHVTLRDINENRHQRFVPVNWRTEYSNLKTNIAIDHPSPTSTHSVQTLSPNKDDTKILDTSYNQNTL